jgi:NAD(P)-dependent dehydrogenase (short-subunit alcohol dehydrogenase family)
VANRKSQEKLRSVVISGASSGIGEACALHLDRLGWRVFAGVRREEDGEALRKKASERLAPLSLDVTDSASISAAGKSVAETVGSQGLDGLVNNAGIPLGGPLEYVPLEQLRHMMEVNYLGMVAVTQAFLPLLRPAGGRIVNMSSITGVVSLPFMAPYAASKFAMEAASDAWRVELRPWGIDVSIIEPGSVETPIWDKGRASLDELLSSAPAGAAELYGPAVALRERLGANSMPVEIVARAVEHALTAKRPKARYLLGREARFMALLRFLPVRLRDRLIASQLPDYGNSEL